MEFTDGDRTAGDPSFRSERLPERLCENTGSDAVSGLSLIHNLTLPTTERV